MPTRKKSHTYALTDRVTLLSGSVVLITKLRATPGADVRFASMRSQPWYEGINAAGTQITFPESSVQAKFEEGYPKPIPRVLAAQDRLKKALASKEVITFQFPTVAWKTTEDGESLRQYDVQADRIVDALVHQLPAGISDKVFAKLVDFHSGINGQLLTAVQKKKLLKLCK